MDLSRSKRLLYVIAAFCFIALMGGAVYGWPSMRQMLKREATLRSSACESYHADESCNDEELSLGLVFTVGSWSNQGGRLLVGIVLDQYGPRWTSMICALVCGIGAVVFALMSTTTGLAIGFFFIGVGGAGMQLSLQSVSALFPQNKGLVMAMLSGAFQAASAVFLLFETLHRLADLSLRTLMLTYAVVLLISAVASYFVWPMQPFGISKTMATKASSVSQPAQTTDAQATVAKAQNELPLNRRCFREQVLSPEYLLMTTFFTFAVLQCQFTIGTIGMQFELKGDDGDITRVFNLIFSLSWTITPLIGHLLDRCGYTRMLVILNGALLSSCACLLAPWHGLQFVTALLYTIGRVGIWSTFFSFTGSLFGFHNYGKLAGGGLFIASCFSLLQYLLLQLTLDTFEGDFVFVNCFFILIHLAMYLVIARLTCHLTPKLRQGAEQSLGAKAEKSQDQIEVHGKDADDVESLAGAPAVAESSVRL